MSPRPCYTDLAVTAGQADRCLLCLRQLAGINLLHEPLHARLIEVLAASNLRADALSAYADIRLRLVDNLGIEPGDHLREAHLRVLRQEPARPLRARAEVKPSIIDELRPPAQLPADIHQFSGRADELRQLDRVLADLPVARAVVITACPGLPAWARQRSRCIGRIRSGTGFRSGSSMPTCTVSNRAVTAAIAKRCTTTSRP